MRCLGLAVSFALVACGTSAARGPIYAPSEVTELGALPPGFVAGENLRASCSVAARAGALRNEKLADVDCSFERLGRVLRARAGELSALFIVGEECQVVEGSSSSLTCSATLAKPGPRVALAARVGCPEAGPAPSPAQVLDLDDPRPEQSQQIRVSFAPTEPRSEPAWPPRAYDRVAETTSPSVGRRALGQLSARCDGGCPDTSLRYALRVTAGQVGAGEVSNVRCFAEEDGERCVALALVPWSS